MRPRIVTALLVTALSLSIPAAAPAADVATAISQLDATLSGEAVTVGGTATFGGLGPVAIGTDETGDAAYDSPAALGLDLTSTSIGQPNASSGDLELVLDLADLPPTGAVPEGTWYAWDLIVDPVQGGPSGFRVSGSRTDLAGPNPAVDTRTPTFKVSPCGPDAPCTEGTPVSGTMDGEANRITVTIPLSVLAGIANAPVAGATIRSADFRYRGAVASTDPWFWSSEQPWASYDRIEITGTHTIAERDVALDLVPTGETPSFGSRATLGDHGSFAATLSTARLGSGAHDLWARACFGTNCATRSVRIEL
jgi:hypothetical protein